VTRRIVLFLSLTLLIGGLSGCDGAASSPDETPIPVVEGLEGLDSYHVRLSMSFDSVTSGSPVQVSYEMYIDRVADPFAQYVLVRRGGTIEDYEFFYFPDRQYLIVGGGECLYLPAEGNEAMEPEMFKPDEVLGEDVEEHRVQPDEYVNDVLCRHYVIESSDDSGSTEGEVWVAVEGNYIVKYVLQTKGADPETGDVGRAEWEYEVSDINAPIAIERPTDCEEAIIGEFPGIPSPTD